MFRKNNLLKRDSIYASSHLHYSKEAVQMAPTPDEVPVKGSWIRDLTCEGVEPNPGPKKSQTSRAKKQTRTRPPSKLRRGKGTGLFATLGNTVGGLLAGTSGARVGRSAGDWFSKITGMGDYKIQKNSLLTNGNGVPVFHNSSQGCVVTHREFLTDITGSTSFNLNAYDINPGLSGSFPWLSTLAPSFEQYELLGLVYEYRPTCATSVGSTNTAQGVVVMATNYDTLDTVFTTKQQMEAYEFSTSCVPYGSMIHPIECNPRFNSLTNMFVRNASTPSGSDQRFYDAGKFQIATVGMQSSNVVGELWISYSVRLLKPKLPPPSVAPVDGAWAHFKAYPSGSAAASSNFGTSASTANCKTATSYLNVTVRDTNTLTFPELGTYLCVYNVASTATLTTAPTLTIGANLSQSLSYFNNGTESQIAILASNFSAARNVITKVFTVEAAGTSSSNDVTFSGSSGLSVGNVDFVVVRIPSFSEEKESKQPHGAIESRLKRIEIFLNSLNEDSGDDEAKTPMHSPVTTSSSSKLLSSSSDKPSSRWFGS